MKRQSHEQRIDKLEQTVRMLVVTVVFLIGWLLVDRLLGAEPAQAALLDRQQFPQADWGQLYYLTTSTAAAPEKLGLAGAFVIPSASRQQILERAKPARINDTLYRIDLRDLQWDWRDWLAVLEDYPYARWKDEGGRMKPFQPSSFNLHPSSAHSPPLVIRMDWLIVELTDANAGDSYYRLLYGGDIPATRDEFLKFWNVDNTRELRFGLIEGDSGVSKQRIRWIENRPLSRGYLWGTRDSLAIRPGADPLEAPDGAFAHDGEEWIAGIPKFSLASGERGALQVYFLADGQGRRIDKADGDLVEDYTRFRGKSQIRTAGSCIQCHHSGLNEPSLNEFRQLIAIGVDVYANKKELQEQLELFHLSNTSKELARNNEDFATAVKLCNGLTPAENASNFKACINAYDADLTLADAARELNTTADELQLALADWNNRGQRTGARLAALAHGKSIPRTAWEREYGAARAALQLWRKSEHAETEKP